MTDHTSTPQASRSRGAATAANISEAGAILRSLDFLFFPEVDATLRKYRPRPLTALEVWFDLNKRAHAMRDRTFSPPPLKEFRDIWRCGLGRVQRLVGWLKKKRGLVPDGRQLSTYSMPMAEPTALWSSSDPSDFSSWPKPWTRGQMGSYIAAHARAPGSQRPGREIRPIPDTAPAQCGALRGRAWQSPATFCLLAARAAIA